MTQSRSVIFIWTTVEVRPCTIESGTWLWAVGGRLCIGNTSLSLLKCVVRIVWEPNGRQAFRRTPSKDFNNWTDTVTTVSYYCSNHQQSLPCLMSFTYFCHCHCHCLQGSRKASSETGAAQRRWATRSMEKRNACLKSETGHQIMEQL